MRMTRIMQMGTDRLLFGRLFPLSKPRFSSKCGATTASPALDRDRSSTFRRLLPDVGIDGHSPCCRSCAIDFLSRDAIGRRRFLLHLVFSIVLGILISLSVFRFIRSFIQPQTS